MAFEGGVEIITIVIAWRGKVVFLNVMLTQCCVVIDMQIKLTVVVVVE